MTSYQGYHEYDLSPLMLILITWLRWYLSGFSNVNLFPFPCLSILHSLAGSHYMQLTLGSLPSLKAECLYKLFVILHSRLVSFSFVCLLYQCDSWILILYAELSFLSTLFCWSNCSNFGHWVISQLAPMYLWHTSINVDAFIYLFMYYFPTF